MKKILKFLSIGIISFRERAGRVVKFHPQFTTIKGKNSVGKSSVIRSIFHALGADVKVHERWKAACPNILLEVSVDDEIYYFFREWGQKVSVFDKNKTCIGKDLSITSGLSPLLAEILDFNLHLESKDSLLQATPAFKFLPFYFDQHIGWTDSLKGFENLAQFQKWTNIYYQYHSGILPNSYFDILAELNNIQTELNNEKRVLSDLLLVKGKLDESSNDIDVNKDIKFLQKELNDLIDLSSTYESELQDYKNKYYLLHNTREQLTSESIIINKTLKEIKKDLNFASSLDTDISCPTCGALYDNSLSLRFSFSQDLAYCVARSLELKKELDTVNDSLSGIEKEKGKLVDSINMIHKRVSHINKGFSAREYLVEEGRRAYLQDVYADIASHSESVEALEKNIKNIKKNLLKIKNQSKKSNIPFYYSVVLGAYASDLNIEISDNMMNMAAKQFDDGSIHPRLILAVKLSLLHTIYKYSDSALCPIVIDTVNQQEQDPENMLRMLKSIKESLPSKAQVILAVVDTLGVDFEGDVIRFHEEKALLQQDLFEETLNVFTPFLDL